MISKSTRNIIGLALGLLAAGSALAAGADLGNTTKQATNWVAIAMFAIFVAVTLGDHQVGRGENQVRCRLLHRRRWHYRFSEWPGDCTATTCPQRPSSGSRVWCLPTALTD
jgi:hypothetical protein